MTDVGKPALDDTEIASLGHLNYLEFYRELTRSSGRAGAIEERDGLLLFASGSTFPALFNGVKRIDPAVPATEVIARADEWFSRLDRGYTLSVRSTEEDADLLDAAQAAGLHAVLDSPEMICRRPLDDVAPPSSVELRWVDDATTAADFMAVAGVSFATLGMPEKEVGEAIVDVAALLVPHVQTVVAYDAGEPVATAQTLLSHGAAGVYWVGTVDAARGKGLGELVTRAATNRAFDMGASFNSLQASVMGDPIYRRMGYEEIYRYYGFMRFEPVR